MKTSDAAYIRCYAKKRDDALDFKPSHYRPQTTVQVHAPCNPLENEWDAMYHDLFCLENRLCELRNRYNDMGNYQEYGQRLDYLRFRQDMIMRSLMLIGNPLA